MMNRRTFLLAVTAFGVTTEIYPAAAQDANNWQPFNTLATAFLSLLRATDPLGDLINKQRFRSALTNLRAVLHDLQDAKLAAQSALEGTPCEGGSLTTQAAMSAAISKIGYLLPKVAESTRQLTLLVKPAELSAGFGKAAQEIGDLKAPVSWVTVDDKLVRLPGEKARWVHQVKQYCNADPARQRATRDNVVQSVTLVRQCLQLCDQLEAKL